MNTAAEREIQTRLFALQDEQYRAFHSALMPTVDPELVIGVRTPALRALVKELAPTPLAQEFLAALPHRYYEENNLPSFLIAGIKDYNAALAAVEAFLPFVDNWAVCDGLSPQVFGRHRAALLAPIRRWLAAAHPYTVRFGIGMLMRWYLDEAFDPAYPALVADIRSDEYYINMMIAWYFATALAKQYDAVLPYLQQHRLDRWTHNKTIQKAVESYRITPEQKTYLRTLRRKA